jgi:hypothetical protein
MPAASKQHSDGDAVFHTATKRLYAALYSRSGEEPQGFVHRLGPM